MANTVNIRVIDVHQENQRIDNYLLTLCKGVPKTRIYRALRKGEVRVNQKRVKPDYRLSIDDAVRIPPFRQGSELSLLKPKASSALLDVLGGSILQENEDFIIVNKPAGIPVHGGTGIATGLIEAIRVLRPQCGFLELVHRIDRATSGCLMIAKNRSFLLTMHRLLAHKQVSKHYFALVRGAWVGGVQTVSAPLRKNELSNGKRVVIVDPHGKPATTVFRPIMHLAGVTLVDAAPLTGRTHQIRVHAAHIGHPIAGDEKYGDADFNKHMQNKGLSRLFLHAASIYCRTSTDPDAFVGLCAPLDLFLKAVIIACGAGSPSK